MQVYIYYKNYAILVQYINHVDNDIYNDNTVCRYCEIHTSNMNR